MKQSALKHNLEIESMILTLNKEHEQFFKQFMDIFYGSTYLAWHFSLKILQGRNVLTLTMDFVK